MGKHSHHLLFRVVSMWRKEGYKAIKPHNTKLFFPLLCASGMIKAPIASSCRLKPGQFYCITEVFMLCAIAQANCIAVVDTPIGELCCLSSATIVKKSVMTDTATDNICGIRQPILQSFQRLQCLWQRLN